MSVTSLLYVLVGALVSYGLVVAAMLVLQPRLLFLPNVSTRSIEADPGDIGLAFEPVAIRTADGILLDGWYVPAVAPRGVLLFFHGNAGNISHRLESVRIFHELDLDVLLIDYRGYGRSEGSPSEAGLGRDAEAAWRYLVEHRETAPEKIVIFGRSLGASVAARLAADRKPAGVILESGFVSVPDLGARMYPWLPVRTLSRLKFPTIDHVRSIRSPVMIVHSRGDEIIPFADGQALYEAASAPKRFLEIEGGHNDGFLVSGRRYTDGLAAFLAEVL
ncbi:alpha/beta hydrolase [Microbaculum marinum]|uniref:Alpha/beta hydrolase n=1 Tax=Microbaculum marinum TaxID=1764581 RepID=A0AAW9RIZ0_9HYPH